MLDSATQPSISSPWRLPSPRSGARRRNVADRLAASRAFHGVLFTASGFTAIYTGQSDGPTFDGVLASAVAFRNNGHFTTELLGSHAAHATSCQALTQTAEAAWREPLTEGRQVDSSNLIHALSECSGHPTEQGCGSNA